ncbi:hypothetical protein [Alkalihalobacterium bogoriense]|uniref:hypothetical protein n=1 Tax=Alkalihalobacterium bogoriense TaxID=246272 RepID=UPI000684228A|nr:hypothetical protein [Alkalihalobacterium bogoriense]
MSHDHECDEFRCPPVVPADAPDDFCIPEECCPERIRTPKFPSPNTCLPQEELEELERKISEANELLLSLALTRGNEEEGVLEQERLRTAFEGLKGKVIKVEVSKENQRRSLLVRGIVSLVGRDFVLLEDENYLKIIRLEDVCSIKSPTELCDVHEKQELIGIDPCLRRAITLDFGATVAKSPELIQIFFGIDLKTFLCFFEKRIVRVKTKKRVFIGRLIGMEPHEVIFRQGRRQKAVPVEEITLLKIKKRKK